MSSPRMLLGCLLVCSMAMTLVMSGDILEQHRELNQLQYVATTTPASRLSTKSPSRYEQGLEDYEEAVARVEKVKENQREEALSSVYSLFGNLNSAWEKVNNETDHTTKEVVKRSSDTELDTKEEDVGEGRYIKGDPLSGYYDFIITEGSYKFWATFQLLTAILMIYSTFAAIYYSKVNPIVSDYDYITYLGGRSLADDPEPLAAGAHPLSSLLNSGWMQNAAHGFEFVLDAIEKIPAQR